MKLTNDQIFMLWRRYTDADLQRYVPYEDDGLGFARAIESTVRQQDAELVRELVEALQRVTTGHRPADSLYFKVSADHFAYADSAITRAQQWLEENKCP